jgi:Holliday junction resolvasome RuvABC DNA-binding subunit
MSMALDVAEIAQQVKNVNLDILFEFVPLGRKGAQRMISGEFKPVKGVFLDIAEWGESAVGVRGAG